MAGRSHYTGLSAVLLSVSLVLSACDDTSQSASQAVSTDSASQAEADLAKQAAAMQKTILEGALAGAAVGTGFGLALGGDDSAGTGFTIGLGGGALAGTYVAFVQRKYANKEKRLKQIKSDLDRNAAEMQTTLNVMNQVLAAQQAELAELKGRAAAGTGDPAALQQEVAQANENLSQMQLAIDGSVKRQAEFNEARSLTLARGQTASPIDGDLAALSDRITQMRDVASDLASSI